MNPAILAIVVIFTPLVAFATAMLFCMKAHRIAQGLILGGGAVSVVGAFLLLLGGPSETQSIVWLSSGSLELSFGFMFDGLSLSFGAVVALITFLVQVYSIGYMHHDPAKTRYFALLGLFGWAMLGFVYAVDLLQALIFWELVGLASFFLIGFWYEKPSASAAARKAFLLTRIGDTGLLIGILLIINISGMAHIPALLDAETGLTTMVSEGTLTLLVLLIFMGIMGKSAQFPLHTWLPDAMEGPTPVSALLHSATMVAAGVFLFARLHPLFMASETAILVVLCIAIFTALMSATIAMVETDLKKVLAYSSIGQLAFMLAALAAGGLLAGILHLILHAVFKALLFLCAGSYIHHFETNDMREIGRRGGRRMRWTTAGLVIGGASLAGLPPLAGFFSKEEVLASLSHGGYHLIWFLALFAAFLTAYYTFRMVFFIILPDRPLEADATVHDSSPVILGPIIFLTIATVLGGLILGPLAAILLLDVPHHSLLSMLPAILCALAGVFVAWWDFGRSRATRRGFVGAVPVLHRLFSRKWYVDDVYQAVFARFIQLMATVLHRVEVDLLDGGADRLADVTRWTGGWTARLQSGWVQAYIASGVVVVALAGYFLGSR
ncbi:MAG: NADH-quinone oxidoreductase subunit L [Candidatus Sumerlaeia bacterium]|nr:NADH-quinone oxidoreductase subunit L [Candidatus Sumerlaeia bacterium]